MKFLTMALPVFAGLFLLNAGCGVKQKTKPLLGEVDRLPRLETILPEKEAKLAVRKSYAATVEAFEKADLCAQVRGVIKTLADEIDIGRHVKKDAVLVSLEIPDLLSEKDNKEALLEQFGNLKALAIQTCNVAVEEVKEAQAQLKKFQGELDFRKLQYERVYKLAQTDTVARQLVDESALQLTSAQAALKAAMAQIDTKQARLEAAKVEMKVADSRVKVAQAEFERAKVLVGFSILQAPFDGIITKRWINRGAMVKDPGMPLLTLMRTDLVRVLLDVPERDVALLTADSSSGHGGNPVVIQIPALQESVGITEFKSTVTLTAAALDPVTRTMRCEVHLPNKSGYLKPQMTGTATVLLAERTGMTLPSSALVRNGSKVEIFYVADPTGTPLKGVVKRMEVQLGLDDGKRVEIINSALTGRELVIRKGSGVIRSGDYAIAVPAQEGNGNAH